MGTGSSTRAKNKIHNHSRFLSRTITLFITGVLLVPATQAGDEIIGFGREATGGAGGDVVRVSTFLAFKKAVNSEKSMIVEVDGVI